MYPPGHRSTSKAKHLGSSVRAQHRFTRVVTEFKVLPYEERLLDLVMWSLECVRATYETVDNYFQTTRFIRCCQFAN